MSASSEERALLHAQIVGDRTLDARLAERRRSALLLAPAPLLGAGLVALMLATSPGEAAAPGDAAALKAHGWLYALHLTAAAALAAVVGALELPHERSFLKRELVLGLSPDGLFAGKRRALAPIVMMQGLLLTAPYFVTASTIAPPGWLLINTLLACWLGLMAGLMVSAHVAEDARGASKLAVMVALVGLLCTCALHALGAPALLWALVPTSGLTKSLLLYEAGMVDGDSSGGFLLAALVVVVWGGLLARGARSAFWFMARSVGARHIDV
jgi:hypothetical protein